MKNLVSTILVLLGIAVHPCALADSVNSHWSLNLGCPPLTPYVGQYQFSGSKQGGLSITSGACQRTPTNFTKLTLNSVTGATARANTLYAVQTGEFLITPPIQSNEVQPIFTVNSYCPSANKTVNWLYVQWDDGNVALTNTYLMGTADISTGGKVVLRTQYDVSGALYWSGTTPMGGSCNNGVTIATGTNNLGGKIFWTANDGGVFKTNPGKATFFLPSQTIAVDAFKGMTFQGITFDSSSANDTADIKNVFGQVDDTVTTATVINVKPYSNPEDPSALSSEYVDTITLPNTSFNSPKPGILRGRVDRTCPGNVACDGTQHRGRLVCIARTSGGSGNRLICSGENPLNKLIPYNITLFRPYDCPDGYVAVPKDDPAGVYDNFCVAKYEMKNSGGGAISVPDGLPWVGINRDAAKAACQAIGPGYDLLTNAEWQTVARNIEEAFEGGSYLNWSNGSRTGTNAINRGHSDNIPANALTASDDGHPCQGTSNVSCTDPGSPDFSQKRTHRLNNGSVIWDFSGNVSEWLKDNNLAPQGSDNYLSLNPFNLGLQIKWGPKSDYSATKTAAPYGGLGYGFLNYGAGAVFRGGSWSDTSSAGIYASYLNSPASATGSGLGFRCAFHTAAISNAASLSFNPGTWAAGLVTQNTSATSANITLVNSGFSAATMANPPFSVTGTGMSLVNNGCPVAGATLGSGASCTLQVQFAPPSLGAVSGTVSANWTSTSLSGVQSSQVAVTGTGISPPNLSFSPGSWSTGNVVVNGSASTSVTLTNSGQTPATLGTPAFSIAGAGLSITSHNCPASGGTLAGGASCTFQVQFAPTVSGAISGGGLTVNWGGPGVSNQATTMPITGMGVTPANLAFSVGSWNAGNVTTNTTSTSAVITLSNSGGSAATFSNPAFNLVGSGFSLISSNCPGAGGMLSAGGGCTFQIQFAPTVTGFVSGSLTVNWTSPGLTGNQTSQISSVTGTGVSPASLAFSSSSWAAGNVTTNTALTSANITLNNLGSSTATFANPPFTVSGTGMSIVGSNCPAAGGTMVAGASCTLQVRFAPTATGPVSGAVTAQWTSPGLSGTQPSQLTISGTGVSPASLVFSSSTWDAGSVYVNSSATSATINLTNTGGTAATFSNPPFTVSGTDMSLVSNTCPVAGGTLAPGASCSLQVRFGPLIVETVTGTVTATWTSPGLSGNQTSLINPITGTSISPLPILTGFRVDMLSPPTVSSGSGTLSTGGAVNVNSWGQTAVTPVTY